MPIPPDEGFSDPWRRLSGRALSILGLLMIGYGGFEVMLRETSARQHRGWIGIAGGVAFVVASIIVRLRERALRKSIDLHGREAARQLLDDLRRGDGP